MGQKWALGVMGCKVKEQSRWLVHTWEAEAKFESPWAVW